MSEKVFSVLFVCTGNSSLSILAEGLMNHLGKGRFRAFSAGSHPSGQVSPLAVATLEQLDIPTEGFRSKSWDEFAVASAPPIDFMITLDRKTRDTSQPLWPWQATTAHWEVPAPEATNGADEDTAKAFMTTALVLRRRIELMLALPRQELESLASKGHLDHIGRSAEQARVVHGL